MQTAVVTGASRGLGEAIAEALLTQGYQVIGTSTSGEATDAVPNMVKLDLSDRASIHAGVKEIIERADGKINLLYNNAGYNNRSADAMLSDVDDALKVVQVNLLGLMELTALLLPQMDDNGLIMNMSSSAGDLPTLEGYNYGAYNVSKAAVDMYTRSLAKMVADRSLKVIATDPEWVATDMGGSGAPKHPAAVGEETLRLIANYDHLYSGGKYRHADLVWS